MNIRKLLNIQNSQQKVIVSTQVSAIEKIAENRSEEYNNLEYEKQSKEDGVCPHCKNTDIVTKLYQYEKIRSISGGSLFIPTYSSYSITERADKNCCTKCGNEWEKYELNLKYSSYYMAEMMNDIGTLFEGEFTYGQRTIKLLQPYYAETIYSIFKDLKNNYNKDLVYEEAKEQISLRKLRQHFKSIFDTK